MGFFKLENCEEIGGLSSSNADKNQGIAREVGSIESEAAVCKIGLS